MFSFILKTLSPPVVRGGIGHTLHLLRKACNRVDVLELSRHYRIHFMYDVIAVSRLRNAERPAALECLYL